MDWKRIFAWGILLTIVACSASVIIVNRPQASTAIELDHNSSVDSTGLDLEILDRSTDKSSKNSKKQKPTVVDSVGSK